eukprot:TRINITY_DN1659_c0_g1_i1.p1 TRINITY_DN1659_c0_g1~~TRINITY_DN1659_c0_g1_i1.p1  ORF type:complete len:119 (+),score=31.98 TRINITY_DN1659_c0_g1_i1:102-458(+)
MEATRFLFGRTMKMQRIFMSSLSEVFGLGRHSARLLCDRFGVSPQARLQNVPDVKLAEMERYMNRNLLVDKNLKRAISTKITDKIGHGSFGGQRLADGLPAHGQRTHSNARTVKKKRA